MDSIFNISCCYFKHSLSIRKKFNSISILNLWNVLHATLLCSVVSTKTPEIKKDIQPESVWFICHQSLSLLLHLSTENYVLLLTLPFYTIVNHSLHSWVSDYSSLCHSNLWIHQTFQWTLPNFSPFGTITSHCATLHLQVWMHVLPLPTWLEISPH